MVDIFSLSPEILSGEEGAASEPDISHIDFVHAKRKRQKKISKSLKYYTLYAS